MGLYSEFFILTLTLIADFTSWEELMCVLVVQVGRFRFTSGVLWDHHCPVQTLPYFRTVHRTSSPQVRSYWIHLWGFVFCITYVFPIESDEDTNT